MEIEGLYYRTHGRLFKVTALFHGPASHIKEAANFRMLKHDGEAVLAQAANGQWVLLAYKDDKGIPWGAAQVNPPNERLDDIRALRSALAPFAEQPGPHMNQYPCHHDLFDDPRRCGRCGRAIAAWEALARTEWAEPKGDTGHVATDDD